MLSANAIHTACTKNRAEEFGFDMWEHFVIPFFFDRLDLNDTQKPTIVIGGRGCGKTMLLRYLSHDTAFSWKKPVIHKSDFSRIGLYWKADTQFASALTGRNVSADVWESAFNHKLALVVTSELLRCLQKTVRARCECFTEESLESIRLDGLKGYGHEYVGTIADVSKILREKERGFQLWVSNPTSPAVPMPVFLPGRDFITAVIEDLRTQAAVLTDTTFLVYVDEFENLLPSQRRIINTYLKHSERPLIFNIAMKRDPLHLRETVGDQSLENVADYRIHDLDAYLSDSTFTLFAAELLFSRFAAKGAKNIPIIVNDLRNPEALPKRRDPKYGENVIAAARRIFPALTHAELARTALEEPTISKRLRTDIERALELKASNRKASEFIDATDPQAAIVCSCLLYRNGVNPDDIIAELAALAAGKDNNFIGARQWIHNNFIGCLLRLYSSHSKPCPFYAGFDTFIQLARGNIRHFLELCHMSLRQAVATNSEELVVGTDDQVEAARQASTVFLSEIRGRGQHGNQLHAFVLTLGSLFAISHQRPTQSEPERSHFSISGGKQPLSAEERAFLVEAVKWSVLIEERETKLKDAIQVSDSEWILNPIYAPYFKITYRKIRKLELKSEEVSVLIAGSYEARKSLLRRYAEKWDVQQRDLDHPLFSHLGEGDDDAT
jgi:hypothetical protein